jgi:thymidylate synthase ThyX
MISAKIIADSIGPKEDRITSFVLTFPRIILAELNTHRMFTRNSASSRAIPFRKMIEAVSKHPFVPIAWQKEHSGMQGYEYFEGHHEKAYLRGKWLDARDAAVASAERLHEGIRESVYGWAGDIRQAPIRENTQLTKQLCNRILEPFMWHTAILTATEFSNFFALRDNEAAEIHIRELARAMRQEMGSSTPKILKAGEWHIPFGDDIDNAQVSLTTGIYDYSSPEHLEARIKIAVARCARVSYTTIGSDKKHDYAADIQLYEKLLTSGHMSPFEHVAKAMSEAQYDCYALDVPRYPNAEHAYLVDRQHGWCGNFRGFIQHRKMIAGENK